MNDIPLRRNRDFVLLQVGQALSTIGSQSSSIAYPLLVLATTHSPAKAGVVGFANIAPYAIFALFAGVAADRWDRKQVMIAMDTVRVLAMVSIVVVYALGKLTFAQIAIVAFVEGSAFVFFNVAEVGALRSVVPARQLPDAAAAEQARVSTVTLAGPPLGGALFGLGRSLPFLADAVSYVFSVVSLIAMKTPFQESRPRDPAPMRTQIKEGIAWLWGQPFLRTGAVIFSGNNFVFQALYLVLIVVGRRQGLSSGELGGLVAAFGVASLAGSLVSPRVSRALSVRGIMLLNQWVFACFVLFLVDTNVYVLFACVIPVAIVSPWLNAVVIGYRTAVTPDHLIGRVSSVARNIALLSQPLGPLVAGLLLASFSPRLTVSVFAAVCIALAVWSTVSPSIRRAPSLSELDDLPPRAGAVVG
ncbi:MAG TPA: MFS transporter [Gaiellaceae bacterium]|nr:MFS transporter [Gaiellaceae bacterium]